MPAKKGTNRFENFQTLKQEGREALISEFLGYLKSSRVRHQYVTELAEMVAKHITEREKKPCNRATLLRNPRYKCMLLSYMAENLGAGTKNLKINSLEDPKTQLLVMTAQGEASNLKRENERLRSYISQLEVHIAKTDIQIASTPSDVTNSSKIENERIQIRFTRACQSLQILIRYLDSVVSVDMTAKQIIDRSKLRNNVIVDSEIASGFFTWLEANEGIG